jgi:hypothetical protein
MLATSKAPAHSPDKGKDDGVTVCFLRVYAVYDEGLEEDGAVL